MSMIEDMEDAPHTVLRCPECAAPNLRQQNFCAKCGTPLWLSCLQCGAMCAVGENYCGACGAGLEEMALDQVERVEADLRRVQEVRSACRFEEAIAALIMLTKKRASRPGRARRPGETAYFGRGGRARSTAGRGRERLPTGPRAFCRLRRGRRRRNPGGGAAAAPRETGGGVSGRGPGAAGGDRLASTGAALGGSPAPFSRSAPQDRAVIGPEARSCLWPEAGRKDATAPGGGGREMPGRTPV